MPELASNKVKLAPKWDKTLGLFKIRFLVILAQLAKMNRKLDLKSPRFVQFGVNLAQCELLSDIPDRRTALLCSPLSCYYVVSVAAL